MAKRGCTHIYILYVVAVTLGLLVGACSVDRFVPEGRYMLDDVGVVCDDEGVLRTYALGDYVAQSTNTKWFGARVPLKLYMLSGTDTTKRACRFWRKLGEAPVLYDSVKAQKSMDDMRRVLSNAGYMRAEVEEETIVKGRRLKVRYHVYPKERYTIGNVWRLSEDEGLAGFVTREDTARSLVKRGRPFEVTALNDERNRIAVYLRNNGYYKFTKEDIRFLADTAQNSTVVDVTIWVKKQQDNGRTQARDHVQYAIGKVNFLMDVGAEDFPADSIQWKGYGFRYKDKLHFRKQLLVGHTLMKPEMLYNDRRLRSTHTNLARLSAFSYSNVNLVERPGVDTLDCYISVNHAKPHSLGFDVEATNSAGDLGAAVSASYRNKNLFRGAETFVFKVRGAYEAITGLEGYEGKSYAELGAEATLGFPAFLLPFVKREWGAGHNASSEISLQYNLQNRPEFERRVLTAAWRYRWSTLEQREQHRFDLAEVNYVYMPWISPTFKEQYLDSLGKTNAILKYNYENLLIAKMGYTYTFNSLGAREQTFGKNAYTVRFNIETAGNLLRAVTGVLNGNTDEDGQRAFCGIAFAQYVRGDLDYAKSVRIDKNNSVALHGALGVAYPYGNSTQLPFEKRYFAGGANSVRGWAVRSLGPGKYNGQDRGINFLNQTGDIKLDLSVEYRTKLFWKFSGAAFVDGGNIWTIRAYKDQPGGEFHFDKFLQQIAVGYGVGLRMDANFFIVRFDAGMKAINPAFTGREHYPLTRPNFNRDFAFHFAVGMPF